MLGIDVSRWQGEINWEMVKSNVQFAIIKAGGSDDGFYKDSCFEANYIGACNAGLYVGAYYFVGPKCNSAEDGAADAARFIEIIKGKKFTMPVYVDCETNAGGTQSGKTEALAAFCRTMETAGYYAGIYGSEVKGFQELYNYKELTNFCFWVANWTREPVIPYGIWQTSSTGTVSGIVGAVDLDVCIIDYPSVIISGGFNNYSNESTITSKSGDLLKRGDVAYTVKEGQTIIIT